MQRKSGWKRVKIHSGEAIYLICGAMYDEDRKKEGEHEWLEKKMTCHEIDCKVFPQNPNPSSPLQAD